MTAETEDAAALDHSSLTVDEVPVIVGVDVFQSDAEAGVYFVISTGFFIYLGEDLVNFVLRVFCDDA